MQKQKKSIKKLNSLLTALEGRNVFEKDAPQIFQRLDNLIIRIKENPNRTKYFIDSCSAAIINIAAKFYRLVTKNYYINEWTGWGLSFGSMAGAVQLDRKALKEGRIIILE
jgi:hypothetical protein